MNRYQVIATHADAIFGLPYPMVMGYYDTSSPEEAFAMFLKEHAPTVQEADKFDDDIIVVPVPKNGFKYKLSNVYTNVVAFPNHKYTEKEGTE